MFITHGMLVLRMLWQEDFELQVTLALCVVQHWSKTNKTRSTWTSSSFVLFSLWMTLPLYSPLARRITYKNENLCARSDRVCILSVFSVLSSFIFLSLAVFFSTMCSQPLLGRFMKKQGGMQPWMGCQGVHPHPVLSQRPVMSCSLRIGFWGLLTVI